MVDAAPRPLILIRGFGGLDVSAEQGSAYQGFNEGTVYPGRRGENFIYEGFLLRALKSDRYRYTDATNVVGYYASTVDPPDELDGYDPADASGTVVIDPQTAKRVLQEAAAGTIWIYRYYDLSPRSLERYGEGLVRLIRLIRKAIVKQGEEFTGVDIVAHSMGGLVVREALQAMESDNPDSARDLVHRIVTLGTPHRGIAFQRLPRWLLETLPLAKDGSKELASFSPTSDEFLSIEKCFPIDRVLTVVGTNYRTYGPPGASMANRLSTLLDEGSLATNRSDGLVKQSAAQLPGAPRTFVNKCHGGGDSLVTSREAFEITMRFLHGTHRVRLWLDRASVERGQDWFGRSEFYLGVSIKPRYVDFELFHQSPEAENCYGPFDQGDLTGGPPALEPELRKTLADAGDQTTGWAGPHRLIWEGWVDGGSKPNPAAPGLVFRLDVYVGERDTRGIGFSDNVIFRKQYYVQAFPGDDPALFLHTGEQYLSVRGATSLEDLTRRADELAPEGAAAAVRKLEPRPQNGGGRGWTFDVEGTGFSGTFRIAVEADDHK